MPHLLPSHLTQINSWRSIAALFLDWSLIISCFAVTIYFPHPAVYLAAAILIARTQLALAVLMHESAHRTFLKNQRVNDFIGQVFTAAPLMFSLFSYRRGHLEHHRDPMAANDPVAIVFGIADYPVTRKELVWRLFKDLVGISYFLTIRDFSKGKFSHLAINDKKNKLETIFVAFSIVFIHSIFIGLLALSGHTWLYLGLWTLPSLTFLQLFARIRAITEHAGYPQCDDQTKNARSIVKPSWQTFFCGPHAIHYHIEHHQYVRVPFYHLQEVHSIMDSQGILPSANLYEGYGKVLQDVTIKK
jgi:fatty acid desaturase